MAYGLKYYNEYTVTGSSTKVRLEILQKDYTGSYKEIGTLSGLNLEMQGSTGSVYSPITKTSLTFSVIDADDMSTDTKKCGRWEEFYTPDSTLYKVNLKLGPETVWTGFVTPDSWEEELNYRGSIRVTARDMLGALDDIDFEETGKMTIRSIIETAYQKSECPMNIIIETDKILYNTNGQSMLSSTISAETFEGKSWWDALSSTMEALGLVLRWNGNNKIVVTSLRYLHNIFDAEKEIRFINNSGMRTLDPAVKSLEDSLDVKTIDYSPIKQVESDLTKKTNIRQEITVKVSGGTQSIYVEQPYYSSSALNGWMSETNTKDIFTKVTMPCTSPVNKDANAIYLLPNIVDRTSLEKDSKSTIKYLDTSINVPSKLTLKLGGDILTSDGEGSHYIAPNSVGLGSIEMRIEGTFNGSRKVLAYGSWAPVSSEPNYYSTIQANDNEFSCNLPVYTQNGIEYQGSNFVFYFRNLRTSGYIEWYTDASSDVFDDNYPSQGLWVPIVIGFEQTDDARYESEHKTRTIYNESYNVKISRSLAVGSADLTLPAWIVSNVLSYGNIVAQNKWKWKNSTDLYPLSLMVHRQLLCYYAAAASVFTGEAILGDKNYLLKLSKFGYYGRHLVPVALTFDFLSGTIGSTNFREYYYYEDIWDEGGAPSAGEDIDDGGSSSGGTVTPTIPIAISVSPSTVNYSGTASKEGTIQITADNSLSYNITSSASWLTLSASSGQGSMSLTYYITALPLDSENAIVSRSAIITIGTSTVRVNQSASQNTGHIVESVEETLDPDEPEVPGIDDESIN